MVDILFDQDTVTEFWLDELINDSKKEGMQQGMKQGQDFMLDSLVKQGILTKEEAEKQRKLVSK